MRRPLRLDVLSLDLRSIAMRIPRFNLRLALVALAGAALLFSQWPIVQRRQYALKQIDNYMVDANFRSDWLAPIGVNPLRRLLGDQAIRVIYLPADASEDRVAEVERLFPEAYVRLGYGAQ
jgi:hypothetical protein